MEKEKARVKKLNEHIVWIKDADNAACYIVIGQEKALVVDTMHGYENIPEIAREFTDLPLVLVNTHGHGDHIGGNHWFSEAYMNEKDYDLIPWWVNQPGQKAFRKEHGLVFPPCKPLNEGDIIDLGGLTAEMIALPGHTPGGICVLIREERVLITGDSINRHLWMQLPNSLQLREMIVNLDRIAWVKERADRILHGHADGFEDISLFDKLREGLRVLCDQNKFDVTKNDKEYKWVGGKALQHEFDEGSVIVYTKGKLKCR